MTFWNRVEDLLDKQGKNKKELAAYAKIDPSTISKGLSNETCPAADTAVLIARFLGTTVEYLVTGQYSEKEDINNYYKYAPMVRKFNEVPDKSKKLLESMFSDLCETYAAVNKK